MKNKRINYILLLILAVGITITTCTNYFLKNSSKTGTTSNMAIEADEEVMALSERDGGAVFEELPGRKESEKQARMAGQERGADVLSQAEDTSQSEKRSVSGEGTSFGISSANSESAMSGAKVEQDDLGDEATDGASKVEIFLEAAGADELKKQDSETGITPISPLETTTAKGDSLTDAERRALGEEAAKASYYRNRLADLEAQIQKNRESQSNTNISSSATNLAANELKLWDNELNAIYDEILEHLDEEQAKNLVIEERDWMKERDRIAMEASKALAGASRESVEYMVSQAESTRLRAYELVNEYEYLLVD